VGNPALGESKKTYSQTGFSLWKKELETEQ
jgi:hypothetical protein